MSLFHLILCSQEGWFSKILPAFSGDATSNRITSREIWRCRSQDRLTYTEGEKSQAAQIWITFKSTHTKSWNIGLRSMVGRWVTAICFEVIYSKMMNDLRFQTDTFCSFSFAIQLNVFTGKYGWAECSVVQLKSDRNKFSTKPLNWMPDQSGFF